MANIFVNDGNEEHNREMRRYFAAILALALLFIDGRINRQQYTSRQIELTEAALVAGIVAAGGVLTADKAIAYLREQRIIGIEGTRQLANDLAAGRYTPTDELPADIADTQLRNRLGLWTFTAGSAYAIGQLVRPPTLVNIDGVVIDLEPHYDWIFGATEKHCRDCLPFEAAGIRPQSYWDARPQPQSPNLDCKGFRCDCWYREVSVEEVLAL